MFYGCTSLVECPKFSFEKVGSSACREMFMNCNKLINPPKILPATTLADSCYQSMFYSCHKLIFASKTLENIEKFAGFFLVFILAIGIFVSSI